MEFTLFKILAQASFLVAMVYIGLRKWRRQGWQYSTRTLLIAITVAAIALGTIRAMLLY